MRPLRPLLTAPCATPRSARRQLCKHARDPAAAADCRRHWRNLVQPGRKDVAPASAAARRARGRRVICLVRGQVGSPAACREALKAHNHTPFTYPTAVWHRRSHLLLRNGIPLAVSGGVGGAGRGLPAVCRAAPAEAQQKNSASAQDGGNNTRDGGAQHSTGFPFLCAFCAVRRCGRRSTRGCRLSWRRSTTPQR